LLTAAAEFKHKKLTFWLKAFGATLLTWSSRYMMVNCLFLMFSPVYQYMLEIYARQLVMWVILLVSFTPGASGIAEIIFPAFLGEYLPDAQISQGVAVLWRFMSYYPFIVIGAIVLPIWLRRVSRKKDRD
jgi:uncharacterized protein (TIRG00374 family)